MREQIWVPNTTILSEKGLLQWVGMEDMVSKILKKSNTGPCEKKPPLFHTLRGHGSRLMPYSYCAVRLCLLRHLRMRIWDKFARTFAYRSHMHILIHNKTHVHFAGHELSKSTVLVVCAVCGV